MKKSEYKDVKTLSEVFDKYWVPFKKYPVSKTTCGVIVEAVIDQKSKKLYLEQYNSTLDEMNLYEFPQGEYPKTWRPEEDNNKTVNLQF